MEIVREISWLSSERGNLQGLGCDTNGTVYAICGTSLFQVKENEMEFLRDTKPDNYQDKEFEIFSLCFDVENKAYLSTSKGISVFKNIAETESIWEINEWKGPINLSHPSGALIGINYHDDSMGVLSHIGWKEKTLVVKPFPVWGDDYGNWLWTTDTRDPAFTIRRAYYPDRIMLYLVDKESYSTPEDGIRSLHMFKGDAGSICSLSHTFMSCPWDCNIPFSIEIPHAAVPSELLLFGPSGVVTERGKILLEFDDEDEINYTHSFSATDFEGCSKRRFYVSGFTNTTKNILRILALKK